jgi:hypothetical protein
MSFFILAKDGGGIRGILQARLIERLQAEVPFLEHVEFFAGTSIGGINAAFLAKNRSCDGLVDLYRNYAKDIFSKRDWWDGLTHLDEMVRANYDRDGLKEALETVFEPDETFADLATKCMVVTFDLDNMDEQSIATQTRRYTTRSWKAKYGHNFDPSSPDSTTRVIDWLFRTSAAPTYFESHDGYVDGGVVDNNPSAAALVKAVKEGYGLGQHAELMTRLALFLEDLEHPSAAEFVREIRAVVNSQIYLLSLGTGLNPHYIPGKEHDYGYKQWLSGNKLLNMLFDGMLGPPDYTCRQLLGENYHRINPQLPEVIDLDEADRVDDLLQIADDMDIGPTVAWLRERCRPAA